MRNSIIPIRQKRIADLDAFVRALWVMDSSMGGMVGDNWIQPLPLWCEGRF